MGSEMCIRDSAVVAPLLHDNKEVVAEALELRAERLAERLRHLALGHSPPRQSHGVHDAELLLPWISGVLRGHPLPHLSLEGLQECLLIGHLFPGELRARPRGPRGGGGP